MTICILRGFSLRRKAILKLLQPKKQLNVTHYFLKRHIFASRTCFLFGLKLFKCKSGCLAEGLNVQQAGAGEDIDCFVSLSKKLFQWVRPQLKPVINFGPVIKGSY